MSTQDQLVKNLAAEQRRRLVASLMDFFEKRVCPIIPAPEREAARKAFKDKLMQSAGQYHDVVLDLVKSIVPGESELLVNEEALRLLTDVHNHVMSRG